MRPYNDAYRWTTGNERWVGGNTYHSMEQNTHSAVTGHYGQQAPTNNQNQDSRDQRITNPNVMNQNMFHETLRPQTTTQNDNQGPPDLSMLQKALWPHTTKQNDNQRLRDASTTKDSVPLNPDTINQLSRPLHKKEDNLTAQRQESEELYLDNKVPEEYRPKNTVNVFTGECKSAGNRDIHNQSCNWEEPTVCVTALFSQNNRNLRMLRKLHSFIAVGTGSEIVRNFCNLYVPTEGNPFDTYASVALLLAIPPRFWRFIKERADETETFLGLCEVIEQVITEPITPMDHYKEPNLLRLNGGYTVLLQKLGPHKETKNMRAYRPNKLLKEYGYKINLKSER